MDNERLESKPYDWIEPDPVIEAYKRDLDRTLLRENLAKSARAACSLLARRAARPTLRLVRRHYPKGPNPSTP